MQTRWQTVSKNNNSYGKINKIKIFLQSRDRVMKFDIIDEILEAIIIISKG